MNYPTILVILFSLPLRYLLFKLIEKSRCLLQAPVVWVPTPRGLALQPSRQNLQSILVGSGEVQIVVVFSDVNEADPADRLILVVL